MNIVSSVDKSYGVPKKRKRRLPYSEDVDEPCDLLQEEAVDVERQTPDKGNPAIERIEPEDDTMPPAFEE